MPKEIHSFKRLVLGLQPGAHDSTMQLAVELAGLLHLDLLGLFLEDNGLIDFASMPFSREFRPLGGGWQVIDPDRLLLDFELAARGVERKFLSAAKRLATECQFKVARGSIAQTFASVSRNDDIVMISEPRGPAERATQQFSGMVEGAFRSAAAVMLVPPRVARTKGPVVAIAASFGDPSILAAAAIAFAAKEEMIIIASDDHDAEDPRISQLAAETGLVIRRMAAPSVRLADPAVCAQAFHQITERLIVMTRGALAEAMASAISAARRVPVLVIEPPEMPPDEPTPPPGR